MKSNQLKYAEIFSFLALIFFLLFILSYNIHNKQNKDYQNEYDLAPIIIDEKVVAYHFKSGDATLPPKLKQYIEKTVIPNIESKFKNNKQAIDTIEVIGHTDGQPIKAININSNLDEYINQVATDEVDIQKLVAASNADLGLMRALAVVKELKRIKHEGKSLKILDKLKLPEDKVFRAYSAGQLTDIDGTFAKYNSSENKKRRRIEIRFTKLNYNKD